MLKLYVCTNRGDFSFSVSDRVGDRNVVVAGTIMAEFGYDVKVNYIDKMSDYSVGIINDMIQDEKHVNDEDFGGESYNWEKVAEMAIADIYGGFDNR